MANYSLPANITGFDAAFDYSASVVNTGTGFDAFGPLILLMVFMGFFVVGSKYTQERALLFSSFMTFVAAFLMVSGHYLAPAWMILTLIMFLASAFLANRVG